MCRFVNECDWHVLNCRLYVDCVYMSVRVFLMRVDCANIHAQFLVLYVQNVTVRGVY